MTAALEDVADALVLPRGRGRVHFHDLAEADDRVQRRAQLVAHAREEFALRPARRLQLLIDLSQLATLRLDLLE